MSIVSMVCEYIYLSVQTVSINSINIVPQADDAVSFCTEYDVPSDRAVDAKSANCVLRTEGRFF